MEIHFPAIVHQCNIAFSVVHVQVCFKSFFLFMILYFSLPARVAANSIKRICTSGWFVRMESNNYTPSTNNYMIKNI